MAQTDIHPLVGIVCGSGLGGLADLLKDPVAFNYKDIPNFPQSTGEWTSATGAWEGGCLKIQGFSTLRAAYLYICLLSYM